jgi:hippurate hydrolase
MPVNNRIADLAPEIAIWRREFHTMPEIQFDLPKTTAKVEALLRSFGVDEVTTGVGRSGIVAVIKGCNTASNRVIGFRADMDALPIHEATGLPHASNHPGQMHACGHDGHTAILLGAAKYLCETRNFDGTVALAFQPAEEGGGGAKAIVEDGLITRWGIQEIYGLHNLPSLPTGHFAIRPGALLATADFFEVTVRGKGGHGAMPHLACDPTLAASAIVLALQQIVSRAVPALESAVISVCGIATDTMAHNVIPDSVKLTGTVRTLDKSVLAMIKMRMAEVIAGTATAYGVTADFDYEFGVNVTFSAPENTDHAIRAARAVAGEAAVQTDTPPMMGGEDFSDMLEVCPGAFIFLGNGESSSLHHPGYEFNDEAIPAGASWFAALTEQRLPISA